MSTKSRKSSIAAFLFMPQFHLSMEGLRDLAPVFVRTLALIMVQTGLLANNHPATRYGAAGVESYSFVRLMGEAWFSLRNTKSSPTQWGLFIAITMMIALMVCSIISFVMSVAFNLGAQAQAQLFSLNSSLPAPYGTAGTGSAAVRSTGTATGIFDLRIAPGEASQDFGLLMLDKVLRSGAEGVGGSLQNAFSSLMQIYNTGILLIAGIIVFWIVLSVVVDTAKTGQIGGGRHNMVWAPIRIIFALGLMIPLGGVGFSSGQFMVMKLAEWGSVFATNAWYAYVDRAISDQSLLAPYGPQNASDLVGGISKIMVCQVAHNVFHRDATVSPGAAVDNHPNFVLADVNPAKNELRGEGKRILNYTNSQGDSICGKITYYDSTVQDDENARILGIVPISAVHFFTGGSRRPIAPQQANAPLDTDLSEAINNFRDSMKDALVPGLTDNARNSFSPPGRIIGQARQFACAFVRYHKPVIPGTQPSTVDQLPQCAGLTPTTCGSDFNATPRQGPDASCQQTMIDTIVENMNDRFATASIPLNDYLQNKLIKPIVYRGWPAMGMFYQQITMVNNRVSESQTPPATFEPGSYWTLGSSWKVVNWLGMDAAPSQLEADVHRILGAYDNWWNKQSKPGQPGRDYKPQTELNTVLAPQVEDYAKAATGGTVGGVLGGIINKFAPNIPFSWFQNMGEGVYPLTQLNAIGSLSVTAGLAGLTLITLFQSASTVQVVGTGAGSGMAMSLLVQLLWAACLAMTVAGLTLVVWLPLVPLIRVAFSVLTWIISVFEAVVMLPIAALAHLSSEGEGLAGGAKGVWILWLNILLRPVLVVIAFAGAFLVFNAFVIYFNAVFFKGASLAAPSIDIIAKFIFGVMSFIIYTIMVYIAANTCFKMLDTIPSALMRWLGSTPDSNFDDKNDTAMLAVLQGVRSIRMPDKNRQPAAPLDTGGGASQGPPTR